MMIDFVRFPDLIDANQDGLLAHGGDLTPDTLVSAYAQGIFPWFNHDQPILWWSPDPRLVLYPQDFKTSKSLQKTIRAQKFTFSCDREFSQVVSACALRGLTEHADESIDTWIGVSMQQAYQHLHQAGYAHSIEVWQQKKLVGGLYGVALGKVFFGESMFSRVNDASKLALRALCDHLSKNNFKIIDCQVASDHLFSLGAQEIPRADFVQILSNIDIQQAPRDFANEFPATIAAQTVKT